MAWLAFFNSSSKNGFAIFLWAVAVGSKGCMWAVTASAWTLTTAMGIVTGAVWAVTASM